MGPLTVPRPRAAVHPTPALWRTGVELVEAFPTIVAVRAVSAALERPRQALHGGDLDRGPRRSAGSLELAVPVVSGPHVLLAEAGLSALHLTGGANPRIDHRDLLSGGRVEPDRRAGASAKRHEADAKHRGREGFDDGHAALLFSVLRVFPPDYSSGRNKRFKYIIYLNMPFCQVLRESCSTSP